MSHFARIPLCIVLLAAFLNRGDAFFSPDWRISPERINIAVGAERELQALDDKAQELTGVEWSINDPSLAAGSEENGRFVLRPLKPGTVRVTAVLNGERRYIDIPIWADESKLPQGGSRWGMHPIGRELGDIAAVPTENGPNMFSLEQTFSGDTYLRGTREDGIQIWAWHLPEPTKDVELICGDWLGGALIGANRASDFTLYTVGSDGRTRWKYTLPGSRKSHAITVDHLTHILSQSKDGTSTLVSAIDKDGALKFQATVPPSHERTNVTKTAGAIHCLPSEGKALNRTLTSKLFVNIDGFAYLAFTQTEWDVLADSCPTAAAVDGRNVRFTHSDRILLWQMQRDGTRRETVIDDSTNTNQLTAPVEISSPTGDIIPDGFGGVLLSVRRPLGSPEDKTAPVFSDYIYRIDGEGKVIYRSLLPRREGELRDGMVLGERNIGFTTRGPLLIAFHVEDGTEAWRWDSGIPGIEVFAALADGSCLVQTPTALVDVFGPSEAREVGKGKAMVDWHGQLYMKH